MIRLVYGMLRLFFLTRKQFLLICGAMICFHEAAVEASYLCTIGFCRLKCKRMVRMHPDSTLLVDQLTRLASSGSGPPHLPWVGIRRHTPILRINGGGPGKEIVFWQVVSISSYIHRRISGSELNHRFVRGEDC
jgi:hypothetical protein